MNKQVYQDIQETIYREQLANGLSVFLLPKEEMTKTYSIFTTNYGSIDQTFTPIDSKEEVTVPEGIAHFLEHKLFEKEDHDVFTDFGKQGASANAYTSFTKTAYLFSATSHIEENVTTLLDFVQDPYFSEQSVEKEKGIIAQEITMYDDQPSWQAFMGTIQAMFKDNPVNINIPGTVESIQAITKDDLYTCYNTFYHPENMVLFIAGNFDALTMMDMIKANQDAKEFQSLSTIKRHYPHEQGSVVMKKNVIKMAVSTPKCTVGIKENVQELRGMEFLRRELLQEMVLDYYFRKGGPFYQVLYEHNLIDASFSFESTLEKNFGFSIISSNTNDPDGFSEKVKELLLSVQHEPLSDDVVTLMKRKKMGQQLKALNSLEFIANSYTHYHMVGADLFECIPTIQSFTTADVNEFLSNWIDKNKLTTCQIVPEQ